MNRDTLKQEPCDTCEYEEGSIYCKEHCPHEAKIEQEPCEDAISRQAVLERIKREEEILYTPTGMNYLIRVIKGIPPVTPQLKTGHWIYTEYHTWCCSECGGNPHKGTGFVPNKDGMKMRWKYCNLCGAKMVEPQESEDKCKNCEYYRNPDYTRCHECKAESEDKE